jgi:hypothetical protein
MTRLRPVQLHAVAAAFSLAFPAATLAQTDYYNTDAGRPLIVEDAYPLEYRGLELQVAPVRLERTSSGVYHWAMEPELAFGVLPRTHVEIGFPVVFLDAGATRRTTALAGVELSALHNFNVETRIPAIAIAGEVLLPVGGLGPARAYPALKGIATRTFQWARIHANAAYTFGAEPESGAGGLAEVSRWMAGVAIDRAFPLRSVLPGAELVARQPIHSDEELEWVAGAGTRYQLNPRWAVDAGAGYVMTGSERPWSVTFGGAYAFGLPWTAR